MKKAGGLSALRAEIERNLEHVYVMEQRGFFTMRLERSDDVPSGAEAYAAAVNAYNQAFDDHQAFAKMYSSDITNKTRAHARTLDQKYDALTERFLVLKPVILALKEKNA